MSKKNIIGKRVKVMHPKFDGVTGIVVEIKNDKYKIELDNKVGGCEFYIATEDKFTVIEEKQSNKSFGAIIDELLNNPQVMMVQAGKIIEEAKKEAEKVVNKNKELEAEIIEKDKEISYLKGKVDTMQDVIKELNAPIEITQEK